FIPAYFFSMSRFVAADEGFYLLAAKLIQDGLVPYRDFLYPQSPYFPYILNRFFSLFGTSWEAARIFGVISFACLTLLLFIRARSIASRMTAYGIVVLFITSEAALGWFLVAKPYGFVALLLFATYLLLVGHPRSRAAALVSGLLLGTAIGVRSYVVVAYPFFLLPLLLTTQSRAENESESGFSKTTLLLALLAGTTLALLPMGAISLLYPEEFWFNNLGFHLLRSALSQEQAFEQRVEVFQAIFGISSHPQVSGYQYPIILGGALLSLILCLLKRASFDAALPIGGALFAISILPSPTWFQYFSITVPFFLVCTAQTLTYVSKRRVVLGTVISLACLLVSLWPLPEIVERYTETGKGVPTVYTETLASSKIESVHEVSTFINDAVTPGTVIFSRWPGFLFETHAEPFPTTENQFWPRVADLLSREERELYHIPSKTALPKEILEQQVPLIVIRDRYKTRVFRDESLKKHGYALVRDIDGVKIYSRINSE
ncbi:MAG: glycosyltransferase family 39 protein, partial [Bdellovibrionales bacterium]|nr:glycosyltransferase family 39 protein [Bdellovibrionales bacterium]